MNDLFSHREWQLIANAVEVLCDIHQDQLEKSGGDAQKRRYHRDKLDEHRQLSDKVYKQYRPSPEKHAEGGATTDEAAVSTTGTLSLLADSV